MKADRYQHLIHIFLLVILLLDTQYIRFWFVISLLDTKYIRFCVSEARPAHDLLVELSLYFMNSSLYLNRVDHSVYIFESSSAKCIGVSFLIALWRIITCLPLSPVWIYVWSISSISYLHTLIYYFSIRYTVHLFLCFSPPTGVWFAGRVYYLIHYLHNVDFRT